MYYELYIDVLFLENFMMDSLLLLAVNRVLKYNRSYGRIFFGGAIGSVLTCLAIAAPFPAVIKLILFHFVINSLMIITGIQISTVPQFIKAFLLLYLAAFALGGVMYAFRPYMRHMSLLYAAGVGFGFLISKLSGALCQSVRQEMVICEVTIYTEKGEHTVKALWDTGNKLTDPLTGKAVSIIDPETEKIVVGAAEKARGFHYIPYRCVQGESIMKVFRTEKICVHMEEDRWVNDAVLGIGESDISGDGAFQLILNPDIFS